MILCPRGVHYFLIHAHLIVDYLLHITYMATLRSYNALYPHKSRLKFLLWATFQQYIQDQLAKGRAVTTQQY